MNCNSQPKSTQLNDQDGDAFKDATSKKETILKKFKNVVQKIKLNKLKDNIKNNLIRKIHDDKDKHIKSKDN